VNERHRKTPDREDHGNPRAITDRFGEVFAVYRAAEGQAMPSVREIVEWLSFINSQCPECSPPEWPA